MKSIKYPYHFSTAQLGSDGIKSREWLLTAADGTHAGQSLNGANRRRYHSLLTVPESSPSERYIHVNRVEELLIIGDEQFYLSAQDYHRYPSESNSISEVFVGDTVKMVYQINGLVLEKTIELREKVVQLSYRLVAPAQNVSLVLRPLLASRFYHALRLSLPEYQFSQPTSESISLSILSAPAHKTSIETFFCFPKAECTVQPDYFWNLLYEEEQVRGYDHVEHCYAPFSVRFSLSNTAYSQLTASAGAFVEPWKPTIEKNKTLSQHQALSLAAKKYLARRDKKTTVIAGYPWFLDWGRDSMISLPGLFLETKDLSGAQSVLELFADEMKLGLIPNCFGDGASATHYNSIDATLWFAVAYYLFIEAGGESKKSTPRLYPKLVEALEHLMRGTNPDIGQTADGLLSVGTPTTQLTWMDASIFGQPVTPRYGYPVEIEALWYNFLRITETLAKRAKDKTTEKIAHHEAAKVLKAFKATFYDTTSHRLADVVAGGVRDLSPRPNVFIALSLPFEILDKKSASLAFEQCREACVCDGGVLSLGKAEPAFKDSYWGDQPTRDAAYHQGTIWPWLTGPFFRSALRYGSAKAKSEARRLVQNNVEQLSKYGIGGVPELVEARAPYRPCGAPFQAWSVAETLRCVKKGII